MLQNRGQIDDFWGADPLCCIVSHTIKSTMNPCVLFEVQRDNVSFSWSKRTMCHFLGQGGEMMALDSTSFPCRPWTTLRCCGLFCSHYCARTSTTVTLTQYETSEALSVGRHSSPSYSPQPYCGGRQHRLTPSPRATPSLVRATRAVKLTVPRSPCVC